jgi:hypothetical protein
MYWRCLQLVEFWGSCVVAKVEIVGFELEIVERLPAKNKDKHTFLLLCDYFWWLVAGSGALRGQ